MAFPAVAVGLLLGGTETVVWIPLGRFLGIALLGLGLACWPEKRTEYSSSAIRAMLAYNVLVIVFLAYLGLAEHFFGLLLWPAVVLHLAMTTGLLVSVLRSH